ncbi:unnamed protein product [Chrysoparadoxa australica]
MPQLKLTYFPIAGRAEATRLAFTIGGIEFCDHTVTFQEFAPLKPTLPTGQLPVLEVDGATIAQSAAILRYAGKLAGLYPEDPLEALKVDEIMDTLEDSGAGLRGTMRLKDEEEKKAKRLQFVKEDMPVWFGRLTTLCEKYGCGSGYAVGSSLTIADLAVYATVHHYTSGFIDYIPTDVVDAYPYIKGIYDKVLANPKVAEYYAAKKK